LGRKISSRHGTSESDSETQRGHAQCYGPKESRISMEAQSRGIRYSPFLGLAPFSWVLTCSRFEFDKGELLSNFQFAIMSGRMLVHRRGCCGRWRRVCCRMRIIVKITYRCMLDMLFLLVRENWRIRELGLDGFRHVGMLLFDQAQAISIVVQLFAVARGDVGTPPSLLNENNP
jgi:hypothetical protein